MNKEFNKIIHEAMGQDPMFCISEEEEQQMSKESAEFHSRMKGRIANSYDTIVRRERKTYKRRIIWRSSAAAILLLVLCYNFFSLEMIQSDQLQLNIENWNADNFVLERGDFYQESEIEEISLDYIPEGFELIASGIEPLSIRHAYQSEDLYFDLIVYQKHTIPILSNEYLLEGFGYTDSGIEYNRYYMANHDSYYFIWESENKVWHLFGNVDLDILEEIMEGINY